MGASPESDPDGPPAPRRADRHWPWLLLAVLGALVSSWGTWTSPWIAEDAAILAHVHAARLGEDLLTPQYGLELVRFWRPVVTATWWLQERVTGVDPLPLRLLNLAVFAGTAAGVWLVVRALGGTLLAATFGALLAGTFPHQGGVVVWLAGRTDGLVALLFVATVLAALAERRAATLGLLAIACATKEFAFVLPAWVGLFVWARDGLRPAWRATWPCALVALALLGVRQLAVGDAFGGYAGGASRLTLGVVAPALLDGMRGLGPAVWALPAFLAAGALAGTARPRVVVAGAGASLAALLPLLPLLAAGPLAEQNERLLWVVDLGFALACAGAFLRFDGVRRPSGARPDTRALLLLVVLLAACALRGVDARADAREWGEAARVGERAVAAARARADAGPASRDPLLWDGFPSTHRGAYCLGFGLADRFRAPFPETARPVWPERTLFAHPARLRVPVGEVDPAGFRDPFAAGARAAPLEAFVDGAPIGAPDAGDTIPVDERVPRAEVDRSPRLTVRGAPPGAPAEVVLLTEAGVEAAAAGAFDAEGVLSFTLTELCGLSLHGDVALLGQALIQTADLGGRAAYLEVRALGPEGGVLEATWPLRLEWEPDVLDHL